MRPPILPFNGLTIAYMALPTLLTTFAKHYLPSKAHDDQGARDQLSFDEAFALVKFFIEKSSQYTVEDIQKFGNAFVPAPWSVRVVRVSIPASTCSTAAQYLIDALGPDELQHVIGGQLWWQRRGYKDGAVEGEWIANKSDWDQLKPRNVSSSSSVLPNRTSGSNPNDVRDHDQNPERVPRPTKRASVLNPFKRSSPNPGSPAEPIHEPILPKPSQSRPSMMDRMRNLSVRMQKSTESTETTSDVASPSNALPNPSPHTPQHSPRPTNSPPGNEEFGTGAYEEDMDTMPCMLYIHGGAYYFGSINTHRYSISRYARKMGGRAFAVNYRLAPQYPFPCALADCLAAYLYLIRPPPEAKHRPVDPSKLVIAGDSAGGGLSLALLLLIRDCGLPAPAGAVLISPWVDLTHSFPSVMDNTQTDIIPPYGFMHQPSTLWPPPPPEEANSSDQAAQAAPGPSDSLSPEPAPDRQSKKRFSVLGALSRSISKSRKVESKATTELPPPVESDNPPVSEGPAPCSHALPPVQDSYTNPYKLVTFQDITTNNPTSSPSVVHIEGKKIVVDQQIQLYATNDQLTHPYCSPAFAPSLGGLPPLYIMAGDAEVLRDEIIFVAHRAAHPERYPLREALANAHPGRKAAASLYPPTKVHLQVYDDMCHVLPLFSFARPAKYCYRAIASFCKFVTADTKPDPPSSPELISLSPPPSDSSSSSIRSSESEPELSGQSQSASGLGLETSPKVVVTAQADSDAVESLPVVSGHSPNVGPSTSLTGGDGKRLSATISPSLAEQAPSTWGRVTGGSRDSHRSVSGHSSLSCFHLDADSVSASAQESSGSPTDPKITPQLLEELRETIYHSALPFNRPEYVDGMIRERVDVRGRVRPLEAEEELQGLRIDPKELGVIKEGPIRRWAKGREIWDHKFMKQYKKIQFMRDHNIKRAAEEHHDRVKERRKSASMMLPKQATNGWESNGRRRSASLNERAFAAPDLRSSPEWQSLSSIHERPPPSSIAARKDTSEARKLAKAVDEQVRRRGHPYKLWSGLNALSAGADSPPRLNEPATLYRRHSSAVVPKPEAFRPSRISIGQSQTGSTQEVSTLAVPDQMQHSQSVRYNSEVTAEPLDM
ncbi:hypothetical protein CROQUDRAFT_650604 [Cronartium quercuum f. sp. fusiforme G11]|uniref:Alpha/beta hydrolase fold-3 domain-containing protein n=1 Tax=Cronartium quercuum f. sp. fusiforme G11 TaxID=708437 RepID=A0A9P6NX84_9BASI|nr:hypothetical protein CROQUDRAFT_650604 [Cronartium quercuum f. sp. fusiforme G11]